MGIEFWRRRVRMHVDELRASGVTLTAFERHVFMLVAALEVRDKGEFEVAEFYQPFGAVTANKEQMMRRRTAFVPSVTNGAAMDVGRIGRIYFDVTALDEVERAEQKEDDHETESLPQGIDQDEF